MNQDEYIKQLEESNRKLQEKLEASEQSHDDYLDKPVYIYMDGKSRSYEDFSFEDKPGYVEGARRTVSTLRYYQETSENRPYSFINGNVYEQSWESDGKCGFKWVTEPSLDIQVSSNTIKTKTRKLKMKWSASAVDDLKNIGNLGDMDLSGIEKELQKEVEKFTKPIKKPTAKQIKKYGNKHVK